MVSTVPDKPAFQHARGHRHPAKNRATRRRSRSDPRRAMSVPRCDGGTKKLPKPDPKDKLVCPQLIKPLP